MHLGRLVVASLFLACGGAKSAPDDAPTSDRGRERPPASTDGGAGDGDDAPAEEPGAEVPYDRAIQKSVHNAYERYEPLIDQLVYHRVRSLELDIHVRREGATAPAGDWFVYHEDKPLLRKTSCMRLSDCLGQLAAFHAAIPRHEVVTVFVDLKDGFEDGHQPANLDAAFTKALGREAILAPADLLEACPGASTLREAVTGACRFPTLRALRGKFLFVTTGGSSCDTASPVARYGGDDPKARLAFVAPNVSGSCTVASYDARPDVVFFNMPLAEKARATEVAERGLVARIYGGGAQGGLDTPESFAAAREAGAVHLATDKVNIERDPWAATHGPKGFPFTCEGCGDDLVEPGPILGVRATSGDQFGSADSAFFAWEEGSGDAIYSALVSVPSSHVEEFAKACLVARASEDPGAASAAVCRIFDNHLPRAQIRSTSGGATTSTEAPSIPGVTVEVPAFLRLAIETTGPGTKVTASASSDGKTWWTITTTTLGVPLPLRGVSVSSHGAASVKALFVNLVREDAAGERTLDATTLEQAAVGTSSTGQAFDGVFPP